MGGRPAGAKSAGQGRPAGITMALQTSPPVRSRPAGVRGARSPRRPQSVEAPSTRCGWRPALAVAAVAHLPGIRAGALLANSAELEFTDPARPAGLGRSELVRLQTRSSWASLGSWGFGNLERWVRSWRLLEAVVDRSLRRRGQSLVVVGALVGALIGTLLGLVVGGAEPSTRGAAEPAAGAALAASSPGSQPPASRAGSGHRSDANPSSGTQQAESTDRPGKRDAKAHQHREAGRDKPRDRGKDKPGKGKNN
jgi:hypothetical protein